MGLWPRMKGMIIDLTTKLCRLRPHETHGIMFLWHGSLDLSLKHLDLKLTGKIVYLVMTFWTWPP